MDFKNLTLNGSRMFEEKKKKKKEMVYLTTHLSYNELFNFVPNVL